MTLLMLFFESNILFAILFTIVSYKLLLFYFKLKAVKNIDLMEIDWREFKDILAVVGFLVGGYFISTLTWTGLIVGVGLIFGILRFTSYKPVVTRPGAYRKLRFSVKMYLRELGYWPVGDFSKKLWIEQFLKKLYKELEYIKLIPKEAKEDILAALEIFDWEEIRTRFWAKWECNLEYEGFWDRDPIYWKEYVRYTTFAFRAELDRKARIKKVASHYLNRFKRIPWVFSYSVYINEIQVFTTQHILVFYNFFKTTLLGLTLALFYFVYTVFFFKIQFLKQLSVWFVIGMMYFWLMSGFNFFLKRYQYGKFTSAIQRFWKRTNTYFWLIEGFLILIFFYYYLNSSQEPVYMYDYSALNQEYLVSLHVIGTNVILLSLIIYFMYFTMLRINSNNWTQLNAYLLIISVFVFFSFFIETYQFYYVISTFNERFWSFNEEENLWSVEIDNPILRTKHQYLLVCLIAKYWHFLFIFLSWVFFLIKSFERKKVTYTLFAANLQNMIILYLLNFACYIQWFKWLYRRFADLPYTWFMTSIDTKVIFRLFLEIKLLLLNFLSFNVYQSYCNWTIHKSVTMWTVDSLVIWKFI